VGDLKHSRATSSFAYGVSKFKDVRLSLVSPNSLRAKKEVTDYLSSNNVLVTETENLADATREADVIYLIRVQKERFADLAEYERVKTSYVLDLDAIAGAKDRMIILHPLPRVDELPVEVDSSPHARYFEEASNGVPLRMALLALVLGKTL
jgi:aspartate carbamoyltransferase catalytic subunit